MRFSHARRLFRDRPSALATEGVSDGYRFPAERTGVAQLSDAVHPPTLVRRSVSPPVSHRRNAPSPGVGLAPAPTGRPTADPWRKSCFRLDSIIRSGAMLELWTGAEGRDNRSTQFGRQTDISQESNCRGDQGRGGEPHSGELAESRLSGAHPRDGSSHFRVPVMVVARGCSGHSAPSPSRTAPVWSPETRMSVPNA
jgi:hypothetical protein